MNDIDLSTVEKGDELVVEDCQITVTSHYGDDAELSVPLRDPKQRHQPRTGDELPGSDETVRMIQGIAWSGHAIYETSDGTLYHVAEHGGHDPYEVTKDPAIQKS